MEKLPTIILPEGRKPEDNSSFLSSPHGRSGEGSEDMSPRGGDSSSVSSRSSSSSTGLQQEMSGGMTYLCSNYSSRSGSSHLLAAPVPAAAAAGGGMPPAPPAEAVPSLVRLASIRLRACKPPLLAEDFYIRRIGMQLLHPSLPPALLRCFRRSSSSLASRRSPGQRSPATSRSSSSCKRMLLERSSSNLRSEVSSGMNNNSGGVASAGRDTDSGGDEGRSKPVVTGTRSIIREPWRSRCSGSGSKPSEWMRASSSGCEAREGSDISVDWPTATAGQQQQQPAEERLSVRRGGGERQRKEESNAWVQQAGMPSGKGGRAATSGGAERDTAATTDKREAEEAATTEKAREEGEADVREKETDCFSSVPPLGETTAAASPVEWQRKKLGSDSSDTYERVKKIGSLRLEEEKERRWALDKKKESPYCVGCYGDAACAKPVAPSTCSAARCLLFPTAKASPETLECLYKQGHHELLLEITPPLLQPEEAGITPKPYHHLHSDVFSRLAFSVSDVNAAQVSLSSHMIRTGTAAQFADVNFAVTCLDLEAFRLRLLQRLSEYSFVRRDGMQQQRHRRTLSRLGSEECPPLGSKPLFHHVELRVRDPAASLAFYQQILQFRLVSKQAVPDFRLTLYFLTTDSTALPPQQAELDSHANRSWLWEQAFSSICLKAYDDARRRAQLRSYEELQPHECGFLGFTLICKQMNEQELLASLTAAAVPFSKGRDSFYAAADVYHIRDPDGVPIRILICDDACGI